MSNKFDWQADDDAGWEDPPTANLDQAQKRRRWPLVLLIMLFAAGAAYFMFRQIENRVDESTRSIEADVLSSHELLQTSLANDDRELFYSLLSGRDPSWTAAQNDLFSAGLLLDRAPFGLQYPPPNSPNSPRNEESPKVTLTPDLLQAEVASALPYEIKIGNGLTETVVLQQTAVYRLGQNRWLLSPAADEFWGMKGSQIGSILTLNYPQRDSELAGRLVVDLERKLEEMCRVLADLNCPDDMRVVLDFSTNPQILADTTLPQTATIIGTKFQVTLPTPTLVGVPIDDEGYQALFRGYASQLVTAVIARLVGYTCCQQLPFFEALVDYQLAQLSLKPWPVNPEVYQRLLDEQVLLNNLVNVWMSADPNMRDNADGWQVVYANVDNLLASYPNLSAAGLQRELVQRGSYFGWLNGIFSDQGGARNSELHSELMRQLWLQAYPKTLTSGESLRELALSTPNQDLLINCVVNNANDPDGYISSLYQYELDSGTWTKGYDTPNNLFINPLPGDDSLLLQEFNFSDHRWQTKWQHDDLLQNVHDSQSEFSISFGQTSPDGSDLMTFLLPLDGDYASIALFDLEDCSENGCSQRALPGIPLWSPNGSDVIFTDDPNLQLGLMRINLRTVLFDSAVESPLSKIYHSEWQPIVDQETIKPVAELTLVGEGYAPFWLDEQTIGYIAPNNDQFSGPGQEVKFTSLQGIETNTLFTSADFLDVMQEDESLQRLFWIQYVSVHPNDPQKLFIVAFAAWDQQAHVFSYSRDTQEIKHLMKLGYKNYHSLGLSPNGRYLVLSGIINDDPDLDNENAMLLVYDLEKDESTPFISLASGFPPYIIYDWSADGEWLTMMLDDNLIGLFAPNYDALQFVVSDFGRCSSPTWINRS